MSIKNVKAAMPIIEQDAQQQDPALSVKSDVGLAAPVESSSSTVGLSRCDADNDISLEAGLLGAGNVSEALQVRPRPRMACVSITPGARDAGAEGEGEGEAGLSGAGAGSASASAEADGDGVDDAAGTASAVRAIDDEHEQRLVTDVGALDALTRTITSTVTGRKTKTEEEQEQEQEQEQKIMVTNASEAEGYAHACQAVFAGYIAVAHRQNLEPTIQGFWATPQRDMILPSLSILADLMPTSIPAPAFRSVDTADHLSVSTDHLHTRAHVQIQVPLEQVATVPYAREKAALHAVLERKDNRYTSACRPPPPPSSTTASTDTDTVLHKSAHTADQQDARHAHSAGEGDSGSSSNGQAGVLANRSSSDRTPTEGVRYRLTPLGRDLFRPMARVNVSGDISVGTSANGKAQMPTPLAGISTNAAAAGLAAPMMSSRGSLAVVSTPAWWDM